MTKIDRLPQTIRVWSDIPGKEDFFCLVVPDPREGETFRNFCLQRDGYGVIMDMFGCFVESDEQAVDIALGNMPDYVDDPMFYDEEA